MNFKGELKKAVLYHLAAGAAFSATLFGLVQTHRYSARLDVSAKEIQTVGEKALRMEEATRVLAGERAEALRVIPEGYEKRSHKEIALAALERFKGSVSGARITVEDFTVEKEELVLPASVEFNAGEYDTGIEAVRRLEEMVFPYFKVSGVTVRRLDDSKEAAWKIDGSLRMPAEKVSVTMARTRE